MAYGRFCNYIILIVFFANKNSIKQIILNLDKSWLIESLLKKLFNSIGINQKKTNKYNNAKVVEPYKNDKLILWYYLRKKTFYIL